MIMKAIFLLLLVMLGISSARTQAASALDLSVYPPVAYLYVKPGAAIEHHIQLKNTGLYTLQIAPQLVDFKSDDRYGQAVLQSETQVDFISLDGSREKWGQTIVLKPSEERQFVLLIAPTLDSTYREHHLSVLFQAQQLASVPIQHTQGLISAIVASNVVLLVSEDEADRGQLLVEEVRTPRLVDSLMGFEVTASVRNIGLNSKTVDGELRIHHWPNLESEVWSLAPDMVLANSRRLVRGMKQAALDELEKMEQAAEVKAAAGADTNQQRQAFLRQHLSERFIYKQAFLLGAYDVEVQIGDSIVRQRVIALPFSAAILLMSVPLLLWVVKWLLRRK
jgi:hypothetical protein